MPSMIRISESRFSCHTSRTRSISPEGILPTLPSNIIFADVRIDRNTNAPIDLDVYDIFHNDILLTSPSLFVPLRDGRKRHTSQDDVAGCN